MEKVTSSGPSGPTGTSGENTLAVKMSIVGKQLSYLFELCNKIIRTYVENMETHEVYYKLLGLKDSTDIGITTLNQELQNYIQGFNKTRDENVIYKFWLGSFNKILIENDEVMMQALGKDDWIRKVNPKTKLPLQIKFGDVVGKDSTICCRLGMIYKMSLAITSNLEQKVKDFPELFKPDEKITFGNQLILGLFKIFYLTDKGQAAEVSKPITIIINDLSSKLGLNQKPAAFSLDSIFEGASPFLSIGTDMLNKHMEASATKEGKSAPRRINDQQLKNIFGKVLGGDQMNKLVNDIKESASSGKAPDMGSVFSSVMKNLNPSQMMSDLQSATEAEIPDLKPNPGTTSTSGAPEKKDEEIFEEVEEVEEVVDEDEGEGKGEDEEIVEER